MAEQAASAVASAVIGSITDRALTTVMRKLRSRSSPAATHEKLQRLETLVLKLRCAVEVSEKHAVRSASLQEWRDKLREAAAEGAAVVLDFQRRAREEEDGDAASTCASAPGQQQPATASALYFTRSALSGMAQRVRDVTRRLFTTDEDVQKLDRALEKMERLSPDTTQFLLTLQLTPELGERAAKKRRALACAELKPIVRRVVLVSGPVATDGQNSALPCQEDREREARFLATELERTLRDMVSSIKATEDRDMEGLEWLAEWAAVRREAVERGNAVLQTLCRHPGSVVIHKDDCGALEEDGELYSFTRAVQRLARDEPCFAFLVELCPGKHH